MAREYVKGSDLSVLARKTGSTGYFRVPERTRGGNTEVQIPLQWPSRKRNLAVVRDIAQFVMFVDGKAVASGEVIPAADAGEIPAGNSSVTMIGSQRYGDDPSFHCSGGIFYGLHVSSTARSQQDFVPSELFTANDRTIALYTFYEGQGQTQKDFSGNTHHGKIVGARWGTAKEFLLTKEAGEVKPGDPSVVDFISLINPVTDAWYGECRKESDVLLLDKDDIATRVQMNHKVQEEYLLVAAVERIAGTDGIQFGLVIGGNLVIFCRLPPVLLRRIRARQRKGGRQQSHHVTRSASGQ